MSFPLRAHCIPNSVSQYRSYRRTLFHSLRSRRHEPAPYILYQIQKCGACGRCFPASHRQEKLHYVPPAPDDSPLHTSQMNVPSSYCNRSDHSPHWSQKPDTLLAERAMPSSPLMMVAFSDTISTRSGVTAMTSEEDIIPTSLFL